MRSKPIQLTDDAFLMLRKARLSTVMTDPSRLRPFTNDLSEKAEAESREVDLYKRNGAGEPLGPDSFPTVIWGAANRGAKLFG